MSPLNTTPAIEPATFTNDDLPDTFLKDFNPLGFNRSVLSLHEAHNLKRRMGQLEEASGTFKIITKDGGFRVTEGHGGDFPYRAYRGVDEMGTKDRIPKDRGEMYLFIGNRVAYAFHSDVSFI